MAEWIATGEPSMDVAHMDVNRFGAQYRSPSFTLKRTLENYQTYYDIRFPGDERAAGRPLRRSPVFAWHRAAGADFGEKSGWERVNFYRSNEASGDRALRPNGRVFLIDNAHTDGGDLRHTVGTGDEVARRSLADGREFDIVKRFWSPDDLERELAALGFAVAAAETPNRHFLYASGGPAA